ncbi:ADP-ribosylglycohydrolase family protein [Pseudolysinimonas sp.]|uniref:ADP-ribosylglycohydrolase family protein n=1 Tax=Pseudolysinimonas sp. TaxID=2680009 RepID=UPI003F7D13E4
MRLSWSQPEDLVVLEIRQSGEEGKDVAWAAAEWERAGGDLTVLRNGASAEAASPELRLLAGELLDRLDATPAPPAPDEPDELGAILADAPDGGAVRLDRDRALGAWLGRAAGCLLGKPVEKIPPEGIRAILESTGRWPLRDYFTAEGLDAEVAGRWPWNRASGPTSLAENIDGMPEDDDLNYAILALQAVESHGAELTTDDVALSWLASLPAGRVFTAERAAYRNLLEGVDPERAARRWNPFREWIGALIRTDVYGWTAPGDPAAAARIAYADARLSHTRNGVYGAMWVAGMSAVAVVSGDYDEVAGAGVAVIPPRSRLADAIRFGDELGRSDLDLDASLAALWERFAGMHWVHVLNNAATIAWALRRGGARFDDAVPLAVMAGWDTDSVGATVGAICGALAGASAIPDRWTAPLHDRIATSLPGRDGVAISALAARTVAAASRS